MKMPLLFIIALISVANASERPRATLNSQPLDVRRLFSPAPGEKEWSDRVFLAVGEVAEAWTLLAPDATSLHAAQPLRSANDNGTLRIDGNTSSRFGLEHPSGLLIVLLHPPEAPVPPDAIRFESQSTGETDAARTARLQDLLDKASPGETIWIAPGEHTVGTLFLRPGVRLHLARAATLVASSDHALYPELPNFGGMNRAFIVAEEAHEASITGQGKIDALGHRFRRAQSTARHPGTRLLAARNTHGLLIEDTTLLDAYAWTGHFQNCVDLTVRRVAVINEINHPGWHPKGPHVTWNNADGLNPDGCRRVVFEDLLLHTGDDAVAVKAMNLENSVESIAVRRAVIWTPVAALKVGTESLCQSMQNIRFEDIHVARCGRTLALDIFDRAVASGIVFRNIQVLRAEQGFLFRAGKRSPSQMDAGRLDRVSVENIDFKGTMPASDFETPHVEELIERVEIRDWKHNGIKVADAESARIRGSARVKELLFTP